MTTRGRARKSENLRFHATEMNNALWAYAIKTIAGKSVLLNTVLRVLAVGTAIFATAAGMIVWNWDATMGTIVIPMWVVFPKKLHRLGVIAMTIAWSVLPLRNVVTLGSGCRIIARYHAQI